MLVAGLVHDHGKLRILGTCVSRGTLEGKDSYPPWDEFDLVIHLVQDVLDVLGLENA